MVRKNIARNDASVKTIAKDIAKKYGLPEESIKIVNPDGRKTRSDAKVKGLRAKYD